MPPCPDPVGLLYDVDGYVELLQRRENAPADAARGLMGRQVAGKEFLDAYFRYGRWKQLVSVVRNETSRQSIIEYFRSNTSADARRQLRVVGLPSFHRVYFPTAPSPILHFPCPPDAKYAWARHHLGQGAFALTGLTHTICSAPIVRFMCDLVEAPFEPFDALVCISRQAMKTVQSVTDSYCAYLQDRHGGRPALRARLAHIPLGVDTERYAPATPQQRREIRARLGIAEDAIVVLFVGSLSYTGKVHPFPMYHGVAAAAKATGKKVHLVLSGWVEQDVLLEHFRQGAAVYASGLPVTIVDGTRAEYRRNIWHSADIFTSLTDNIQETLSQVILEGSACGLPIVATNWDGCRDQVIDGETGLLVPTYMVRGATNNMSSRHLIGESSYGAYLAECNQTVVVDPAEATAAFTRLIQDAELRQRLGLNARKRMVEHFAWPNVIRRYEELWGEQEAHRQEWVKTNTQQSKSYFTPVIFPDPEQSFASYPMAMLEPDARITVADATRLDTLLKTPITSYRPETRTTDPAILQRILDKAADGCAIGDLDVVFTAADIPVNTGRATVAWLLKYGVLRIEDAPKTLSEGLV